ncbi:MAG TPA: serine protease [Bacteroidales bacterium]|jgi:membrane-bound ClpP family serine protease|nr:serine protease [Bacteroidales bacterium]HQN97896.1 NfeD family protein [Bacteroidales bacterium]HQQ02469.1 NfeD family protein [Bacteroidales bacterium]
MSWSIIIILIVIGLIFMVLEILVIPGTSVGGIVALACLGIAIWQSFANYGMTAGLITLGVTLLVSFLALYFSLKSKTWKRLMLTEENTAKVNVIDEDIVKPGKQGLTISRLAPAGKVEIDGQEYEAHTFGEYVDPGQKVIVVKIEFNKIYVKSI